MTTMKPTETLDPTPTPQRALTGDIRLTLTNDFVGTTFHFNTESADRDGVGGDLMHSLGNIWMHINDQHAASLWVHLDDKGEVVIEFGNGLRESEDWEPQATFPLSQAVTEIAPEPAPPGASKWTEAGKAALAFVLRITGQDMGPAVSWNSEGVAMVISGASVFRVFPNGDVYRLGGDAWARQANAA